MEENKQKLIKKMTKNKEENKRNGLTRTETYQKQNGNCKFSNLKLLNNNINIVSKTLILSAHDNVPCAPELGHINGPNTNITKDRD